ncbi:MAG: hypothetical protein IPN49_11125 [Saprospiraceae bacterium]|nr:hypothetical protein [Saprospiraceae bacterium]MBK8819603.1 hypothetical protein [Saprospiraceae bacterium]
MSKGIRQSGRIYLYHMYLFFTSENHRFMLRNQHSYSFFDAQTIADKADQIPELK